MQFSVRLSYLSTRQLSGYVPAEAGFLFHNDAVPGDSNNWTYLLEIHRFCSGA
jgi:hypothetical protein